MLNLTVKAAKANFFDRARVQDSLDRALRDALSRIGAFVRQRARTSLRYRDRPSTPGSPPSAHRTMIRKKTNKKTGKVKFQPVSPLREFIFFAYDPARKSVVIGPALLNAKGGSRALSALEYGGPSTIWSDGKRKQVYIKARPFMRPALEAEQKAMPHLWRNSVR